MSILQTLNKLKGRSARELAVRGGQALWIHAERAGPGSGARALDDDWFTRKVIGGAAVPGGCGAESLLEHFRGRSAPDFFAAFRDRDATLAELRSRWPDAETVIIERAERILEGKFDLLGQENLCFGDPIDWQLDPVADRRAPSVHWSRLDFLNADAVGDHKLIWELNRHQYLVILGKAYWYTGDERYAAAFADHLTAWMDANPPKQGINWASSLEIAFRSIAWIWALHFFRESRHLTPAVFLRSLQFLYLHGRHIERYLSTYFSPNTHLTGEALGLFYLGTVFPEFRSARRWQAMGLRILTEQLDVQLRGDGVYFEQATYYHRYTADFYLHLLILGRANGMELDARIEDKLKLLLDHLMYLTRPDGTTPLIGDDDGGRLLPLDGRAPNDFRAALATGAALFARPDCRFVAGGAAEETLWLLGREGVRRFGELEPAAPAETSRAFRESGYFVMRDGWSADANYLVVDCGPHGVLNCGHAHADALALDLAARGRTFLVDPGTYTYTGDPELRDRFRSSLAHNTVAVDGKSSSVPGGLFQWAHVARSSLHHWITAERFDFFEGSHDGYARLTDPAVHTRSILFIKGEYWIMRDRVAAAGEHTVDARFHFAPNTRLVPRSDGVLAEADADGAGLRITVLGATDPVCCEKTRHSESFGKLEPAVRCGFSARGHGVQDLVTLLLPGSRPERIVDAVEAAGGRLFRISNDDHEDWLALREEGRVEGAELSSDFEWSWARRSDPDGLLEYILINGSYFRFGGEEIFHSDTSVGYATARLRGDELWVETDATGVFSLWALGARQVRLNGRVVPVNADGYCTSASELGEARPVPNDTPIFVRVD